MSGTRARPPAVVIGMDCTTGLQSARILARRGVPVVGVAADVRHPCCRTRACERVVRAEITGPGLIDALEALGPTLGERGVLFPCTDLSVLQLSRHRERLRRWYHVALPAPDVVEMLVDKERFSAFAERTGLPVPPTRFLRTRDDAERAAASLAFPVILKPAVKTPVWMRQMGVKAIRVAGPRELLESFERCCRWAETLIAQEWIAGEDGDHYTCNCYFGSDAEPLVAFTTRKLRQWPITGGEGCLSVEARNEEVERTTIELYRAVRHHGLAYLEMKRDARTGRHLIIEPNVGRPTGRSANAEAAGVALLYTNYCELLGLPLPADRRQPYAGVKWIHFRRDVQSAAHRWWKGELTLRAWLRSWRGLKVDALFSWRDPIPFWADIARVALDRILDRKRVARAASGDRPRSVPV